MIGKQFKGFNTYFILLTILVLVAASTWLIPGAEYGTTTVEGREVVDPDTFRYIDSSQPQGLAAVAMAPIRGFVDAALIVGFVLIVGGAFGVFQRTKAIDSGVLALARAHKVSHLVRLLTIPIFMLLFSLGGAVFGMSEEVIPFILIFVPLAMILGYDSITGIAIPFIGAGAGFAGAFLNPFTIGVAQGIADIPLFSGISYRLVCWLVVTGVSIAYVMVYAARVKAHPEKSRMRAEDSEKRRNLDTDQLQDFDGMTGKDKLVLYTFATGMAILIFGVLRYQWYIEEIAAVFLVTGLAVGIVSRLSVADISDAFIKGAKDLVGTALLIALARGILVIARDGQIIATILHSLSAAVGSFHPVVSSQMMFLVQTVLNFFVPSGSGQAALTMPIMAPLADLVGVTRQTAVLAFQFGDGFSNLIIPTSGVLMGVLTLGGVPWEKWVRWVLPLEGLYLLVGLLLLVPPYFMNWF
ncbi:YfcC family protein [Candidatus Neomarinimicrobiota bacterium]